MLDGGRIGLCRLVGRVKPTRALERIQGIFQCALLIANHTNVDLDCNAPGINRMRSHVSRVGSQQSTLDGHPWALPSISYQGLCFPLACVLRRVLVAQHCTIGRQRRVEHVILVVDGAELCQAAAVDCDSCYNLIASWRVVQSLCGGSQSVPRLEAHVSWLTVWILGLFWVVGHQLLQQSVCGIHLMHACMCAYRPGMQAGGHAGRHACMQADRQAGRQATCVQRVSALHG